MDFLPKTAHLEGGGYTQDTQFSNLTPNLRTARLPPTSFHAFSNLTPITVCVLFGVIFPFNPFQPKYPKPKSKFEFEEVETCDTKRRECEHPMRTLAF